MFCISANCERAFRRMGWMISARRAAITATNADKRLTLCNQLPQKRRLLKECRERKIKGKNWTKIYSNEHSFISRPCWVVLSIFKNINLLSFWLNIDFRIFWISTKNVPLRGAGKILPAREPHPHPAPHLTRTAGSGKYKILSKTQ